MNDYEAEISARDKAANDAEDWYIQNKGIYHNITEINTVLSNLKPQTNDSILDAGCGTGRFTRILAKKCRKIYALDFSTISLEVLAKKAQKESINNVVYLSANLAQEFFLDEKVDKAISVGAIQCIPSESGRQVAVKNVYNSLKNGGTLVMVTYNWNNRLKRSGLIKEGTWENGTYYYRYTYDELKRLFEKCGFQKIEVSGCINIGIYGLFGDKKLLNKLFYPIMILDVLISKFKFSSKLGGYLICRGTKK